MDQETEKCVHIFISLGWVDSWYHCGELSRGEGEEDNPLHLLCCYEIPLGILHPALEFLEQERQGPAGVSPEMGYKGAQRAGAFLL